MTKFIQKFLEYTIKVELNNSIAFFNNINNFCF